MNIMRDDDRLKAAGCAVLAALAIAGIRWVVEFVKQHFHEGGGFP